MMVLGADTHKGSHSIAAVAARTGELLGDRTATVGEQGFLALLDWVRSLDSERVWALEDCRHVSGSLERFLLISGERVVRVATKLMADARRGSSSRGKSDVIDALAVARAALREGVDRLPSAQLAGVELEIRLLVDHRERLVRQRVALNNDLLWNLHDLWPELKITGAGLVSKKWSTTIARRLARAEQTARVRIARDELRRLRELTAAAAALEAEIADLVAQAAPQLLSEPGFGPLTAAKLIGEIAGANRFSTEAKLARAAGVAPIPASSGKTNRHRLDRGGNRQLNATIYRIALTRARCHPETRDYVARKRAEGKTQREAIPWSWKRGDAEAHESDNRGRASGQAPSHSEQAGRRACSGRHHHARRRRAKPRWLRRAPQHPARGLCARAHQPAGRSRPQGEVPVPRRRHPVTSRLPNA